MTDAGPGGVVIGRLSAPHGIRGWIAFRSFTDPESNALDYAPWRVQTAGQIVTLHVTGSRPHRNGYVVQLRDHNDRNAVTGYSGLEVTVPESALPPLDDSDEVYWKDLYGLDVRLPDGERVGRIASIFATGANDVLVVEQTRDGSETLVPFIATVVTEIDTDAGCIVVDWAFD